MDPLELCYMSAGELAPLVRDKKISPVEIIDAHLARIQETEPVLNSFITLLPEESRAAARKAEADILAGNYRGPLHGIPVALKDLYNTGGVRTTSGSKLFDTYIPERDCTVAFKFKEAGSILLGKLNLHQFAYGPTGENPDYGHMHNPWDPEKVAGGSSGGSGSATASGQCTITTGSDTGGSIRIPAALCGIVGLKPTYGLVSRYGLTALAWSMDHPGPMVRTVEDAALAMNAIAGYDPNDIASANVEVPDYTSGVDRGPPGNSHWSPPRILRCSFGPSGYSGGAGLHLQVGKPGRRGQRSVLSHVPRLSGHLLGYLDGRSIGLPQRPVGPGWGQVVPAGPPSAGGRAVHHRGGLPSGPAGQNHVQPTSP